MNRIYLAGPITSLTESQASGWRRNAADYFAKFNIECFSPMRDTKSLPENTPICGQTEYGCTFTTSKGVMSRDYFDVKRADLIFVNFLGSKQTSIGTVMEVAWAWQMQKPIVVVANDDDYHINHLMMKEAISIRVATLVEGMDAVISFLVPCNSRF